MEKQKSKGFFCVAYFILKTEERKNSKGEVKTVIVEGKTVYYHKYWNPSKLWHYLRQVGHNVKWLKIYIDKSDYFSNTKGNNYFAIFDENNPVQDFTYSRFAKKSL